MYEPGLYGFGVSPKLAIGQRAIFLDSGDGLILWDLVPFLDEATRHIVRSLGRLKAIAVSHPHYYSNLVEWSRAFGDVPVYLHDADRSWVTRPDPCIVHWSGETCELAPGVTLLRTGGHFEGASVLHWAAGGGVLLTGDSVQVGPDGRVSFMRSYPNMVPLNGTSIEAIA
jgi:glyoxylase-like metal-dependent hydrolase (beta-lactamase superfamily II)